MSWWSTAIPVSHLCGNGTRTWNERGNFKELSKQERNLYGQSGMSTNGAFSARAFSAEQCFFLLFLHTADRSWKRNGIRGSNQVGPIPPGDFRQLFFFLSFFLFFRVLLLTITWFGRRICTACWIDDKVLSPLGCHWAHRTDFKELGGEARKVRRSLMLPTNAHFCMSAVPRPSSRFDSYAVPTWRRFVPLKLTRRWCLIQTWDHPQFSFSVKACAALSSLVEKRCKLLADWFPLCLDVSV